MKLQEEVQVATTRLYEAIASVESWQDLVYSSAPKWFGRLMSEIVLTTGGQEAVNVSGGMHVDDERFTGALVILTDKEVVSVTVSGEKENREELLESDVRAWSRSELQSFAVNATTSAWEEHPRVTWPDKVTVEVVYPLATVVLSVGDYRSGVAPVQALLDGLRRDLSA